MTKIFIDPGHGGTDPGATGNGLKEKDVTLYISQKLKRYLDDNYTGHTTRLSRDTDKTLSLKQRTDMANSWGADYLISIHINAGGGTGYEDYIFNGTTQSTTVNLRNIIHSEIVKETSSWGNRGKKTANFHMLRESRMPAMLTENGFIDTKADTDKLKNTAFLNSIIKGHALGLAKAFNLKERKNTSTGKLYKVQVGAFSKKANAESLASDLSKKGYETYIVQE